MRHLVRVRSLTAAGMLAAAWLLSVGSAQAAGISCGVTVGFNPPISDNVTSSTGCQLGSTHTDFLGAGPADYQVNKDAMFGFSDWRFAEKDFEAETLLSFGLTLTGGPISGTWSIDDVWTTLGVSELMLVFKGGAAHLPGVYVAYLIEKGAVTGTYLTPFKHHTQDKAVATSHVSVYYRQDSPTVPEPASVALLGLGLVASAARMRRRPS